MMPLDQFSRAFLARNSRSPGKNYMYTNNEILLFISTVTFREKQ